MGHSLSAVAELAVKYVNTTQRNIFLTGKAGSGKTTLLKYIIQNTYKNTVVAAPTGIAAINAGGVTLHSLLQLPFGTFVPEDISFNSYEFYDKINTPASVISQLHMTANKRNLLKEIELLIIDEVSMLRADLLDCIDLILKSVRRRKSEPFGGVQLLFIGDLNQLPPVVKKSEWPLLNKYYHSAYFFESHSLRSSPPIYIELDKIYRQSDQKFIEILNRLRDNELQTRDVEQLNSHYIKNFSPESEEGYIHITTHNRKSDTLNTKELSKLKSKAFDFHATISGDFPEHMFPIPSVLTFKEGAQVMFIKNDPSGEGQFYNGKIGHIQSLSTDHIDVMLNDSHEVVRVEKYVWKNLRYRLNAKSGEIDENVIGSFEQYPLKLAWAITVHKSQGLTFERAILDLTDSFAPGQMYVALSRLTSLDGLVLSTPIPDSGIEIDHALSAFAKNKQDYNVLARNLSNYRKQYLIDYAAKAFDFEDLLKELRYHIKTFDKDENRSLKQKYLGWTQEIFSDVNALQEIATKFHRQIITLTDNEKENYVVVLNERVKKANEYFKPLIENISEKVRKQKKEVGNKQQGKTYSKELSALQASIKNYIIKMNKAVLLLGLVSADKMPKKQDLYKVSFGKTKKGEGKTKRSHTREITLSLYKQGMNIEQIANERELSPSTIEGHLSIYIANGEINVTDILGEQKLEQILTVSRELDTILLNEIKSKLGDEFSYGEVRMAMAHQKFLSENSNVLPANL